ncbi:unnamed protein product [Didymodactylos carnosus]|uniref:Uncharacterized protein n=1 Tax=Didymodactylos carnosus TaxID=1234261 RepID=A0A814YGV9_9BILA|nr:unnamed protein product [Didymodactylos carnosus]CAF3991376.1 unnamed protein product [Didymodactylos carnosus]
MLSSEKTEAPLSLFVRSSYTRVFLTSVDQPSCNDLPPLPSSTIKRIGRLILSIESSIFDTLSVISATPGVSQEDRDEILYLLVDECVLMYTDQMFHGCCNDETDGYIKIISDNISLQFQVKLIKFGITDIETYLNTTKKFINRIKEKVNGRTIKLLNEIKYYQNNNPYLTDISVNNSNVHPAPSDYITRHTYFDLKQGPLQNITNNMEIESSAPAKIARLELPKTHTLPNNENIELPFDVIIVEKAEESIIVNTKSPSKQK